MTFPGRKPGPAGALAPVLAAIALVAATPGPAQQFDNFGEDPFEGFQLGDPDSTAEDGALVPSLGEGTEAPVDDGGVQLNLTEGGGGGAELTEGAAQQGVIIPVFPGTGTPVTSVNQPPAEVGNRVTLRALDRTLGRPTDLDLSVGQTVLFGRIAIRVVECRYPQDDPSSDAYAHLQVLDLAGNELFDGWMVASSPALSALEHPRYDVWVLRCSTA